MSEREVWRIRKQIQRKYPLKGRICSICGADHGLERHHKDADITNNTSRNIQIVCVRCHYDLHAKIGKRRYN